MKNATGIALPAAPIDRNDTRSLKGVLLAVLASLVLSACGGGAQTESQPIQNDGDANTNDQAYVGPVARDADVLSFQQELWSNVKTTDRCGSCHNESVGRVPMFARNDNVNIVTERWSDEADFAASTELGGRSSHPRLRFRVLKSSTNARRSLPLAHHDVQSNHLRAAKHFKLHLVAG